MSAPHHQESFLDRFWQPLVILFGLLFVTLLVSFNPVTYQTEHNVDHNAPAELNSSSDNTSK